MSQISHLPIYNSSLFLLKDLHERVTKFSKLHKYTLGQKITCCATEIIILISDANNEKKSYSRISVIDKIIRKTDELLVYIRIAEELKLFNNEKSYPYLIEKICEISRQGAGWKNIYLPQSQRQEMSVSEGKEMPPSAPRSI